MPFWQPALAGHLALADDCERDHVRAALAGRDAAAIARGHAHDGDLRVGLVDWKQRGLKLAGQVATPVQFATDCVDGIARAEGVCGDVLAVARSGGAFLHDPIISWHAAKVNLGG